MNSSPFRKKTPNRSSLLWAQWEKTLQKNRRRVVLIEADRNIALTAQDLSDKSSQHLDLLGDFPQGARIAFRLPNGAEWMALFLALQKLGLSAVPLDASLPDPACLELAQHLRCHGLFLHDQFHALPQPGKSHAGFCCIKVTSGTSGGLPKSVPCRAEHLLADGRNIIRTMGIRPRDRNLASIPLGHSYGLGNFVLPLILQGTPLVCASRFVPRQLIDWIEQHRVTVFPSVPALFRVLASMPGHAPLAPLRLAISAGAPLTAEVARAFFERYRLKIHNFYGSSETGGICYDRTGHATLSGRSVGKPLVGVTVAAARGVIKVAGAAVAKKGGRWRMPDRGEWNDKGELVLLGRRGREANIGGKKVHPSEVERALRAIPAVSDAMVWATHHADRAILHAAVESTLSPASIQSALAGKLPDWKFPKHYLVVREFPRTGRGKADFAALRRQMEHQVQTVSGD